MGQRRKGGIKGVGKDTEEGEGRLKPEEVEGYGLIQGSVDLSPPPVVLLSEPAPPGLFSPGILPSQGTDLGLYQSYGTMAVDSSRQGVIVCGLGID